MAVTSRGLVRNRTFCEGDNLEYLLRMPEASVDLIATDPPFNKNREFQGIGPAEGANFKDYWSWEDDVHVEYLAHVRQHWPALHEVVEAAYAAHSSNMAAFLAFMSVRLIEMHRILKPTGSIYVHIDHTAHAYVKALMDAIFGRENFRNEIVWCYSGGGIPKRDFPRKHDTILRYTKSSKYAFNVERKAYKENTQQVGIHSTYSGAGKINLAKGTPITDWWTDIPTTTGWSPENTGYPTQKPLALYRRIVEASSNKGDLVLDPFAGCATTCVAAEQLGRHWVGIDLSPKARGITLDRLNAEVTRGMHWENRVHMLTIQDLRPLPGGITASLAVPQLPARLQRGIPRGYKPENVRPYLAGREGAGMRRFGTGNMACQGCGFAPPRPEYLDVDHIVPQAKEGPSAWNNLCLLCAPCNRRKAHKLTIEELRKAIRDEGHMQDESRLVAMDVDSIAKRDRAFRPPR